MRLGDLSGLCQRTQHRQVLLGVEVIVFAAKCLAHLIEQALG